MGELCLEPPLLAVIESVRDGALAWSTLEQIAEGSGLEPTHTVEALNELITTGLIVPWNEWYTLSSECAEVLRVQIEDFGMAGRERWVPIGQIGIGHHARYQLGHGLDDEVLEAFSPEPGPDEAAELAEYLECLLDKTFKRKKPITFDGIKPPTAILTGPAIVWREAQSPATCWRCQGRSLQPWELCLCCLRWGMDAYVRIGKRKLRA